jgi:hypothetical protein
MGCTRVLGIVRLVSQWVQYLLSGFGIVTVMPMTQVWGCEVDAHRQGLGLRLAYILIRVRAIGNSMSPCSSFSLAISHS